LHACPPVVLYFFRDLFVVVATSLGDGEEEAIACKGVAKKKRNKTGS
jgi:hypothetical protein